DARRLVETADPFHDDARGVEREHDLLARDLLHALHERERARAPREQRVDDVERLVLHPPPEILRRDGTHLHQELAVADLRRDAPLRLVVLLLADLAVTQQEETER